MALDSFINVMRNVCDFKQSDSVLYGHNFRLIKTTKRPSTGVNPSFTNKKLRMMSTSTPRGYRDSRMTRSD